MPVYEYNSLPVHYKRTGTGKPLLVLHGWGSSSDVMMPLARQLAPTHTCYLPDLPGFGATPPPDSPWRIDDYADLIHDFIRDLELKEPDILAHSFGGRIILKLSARDKAGSLLGKILITGGAGMKPRRKASFYLRKYLARILKAPFMLLPSTLREPSLRWLRNTSLWKKLGSGEYQQLQGVMRETFVHTVTEFLEPCLPEIHHEVLLLWGLQDDATPLYQARRMEEGIHSAALITIDEAGHYAFLDQPRKFTLIAEAFYTSSG
ncbi:MAG: alpha/beta hydrolase [Balneolales bacterium]